MSTISPSKPAIKPGATAVLRPGVPRFRWLRVVAALVIRDMSTRFGRSAGGYVWAVLEPIGGIALLSIAFSLALRKPPLGTSFMLFYATGMVPYTLYGAMARAISQAVSSNKGLLNYPVVTTLDAVLAKFALTFLTSLTTGTLLIGGVILIFGLHVTLDPAAIIAGFALAGLIGLGVGTMNCVLFGLYPTWKNVWAVLTRPLFIFSGTLFLFESVPPLFQSILWWNPLTHVIALMRSGFYGSYDPTFVSYPYVLGFGLTLFAIGAYLLRRHTRLLLDQ